MNKEKIYDNLVRTVRANVVEKLKTFSQKGLAADLNIPYAYITWIASSKSGLWFQIPKFYIYVLAVKLTIMIPEELMGEKAEEFTKRNVKIDNDGNFTFSKTHHSGGRMKKKDSVVPKALKKVAKEPIEKPPSKPHASFDMKPEGDKLPDLAGKSTTGPDDKPETKAKEKPGTTTAGPGKLIPFDELPDNMGPALDHHSFDKLCKDLKGDLVELINKINSIEQANIELNFLEDREKDFLFDVLINEVQKTLGRSDKLVR